MSKRFYLLTTKIGKILSGHENNHKLYVKEGGLYRLLADDWMGYWVIRDFTSTEMLNQSSLNIRKVSKEDAVAIILQARRV